MQSISFRGASTFLPESDMVAREQKAMCIADIITSQQLIEWLASRQSDDAANCVQKYWNMAVTAYKEENSVSNTLLHLWETPQACVALLSILRPLA